MNKKITKFLKILFLAIILLLGVSRLARADDDTTTPPDPAPINIHLTITSNSGSLYDQTINVNACNSDNGATTNLEVTAYCAISQSGIPSDWNWSLNGTDGATGLNEYILQPNDSVSLNFIDPEPAPAPAPAPVSHGGGGGGNSITPKSKPAFDLGQALNFILAQQKTDGSFGDDLYTDWAAIALTSNGGTPKTNLAEITDYFSKNKFSGTLLTDYERQTMALMALGLNPYNIYPASPEANGTSYIKKIVASFDDKQFDDPNEDNDDIFALIVLQNAGYTQNDKIIANDLTFVLNKQNPDGSWDGSVDMTGAAMEALSAFNQNTDPLLVSPVAGGEEIKNALTKAENFLKQNQKDDGSWNNNASSTAWAMEGILAQGEKIEDWKTKSGDTPLNFLATVQDTDGGIKNSNMQNKIWETAYIVSALSGKTWNQIMQKFDKPTIPTITVSQTSKKTVKKPKIATISKNPTAPISPTPQVATPKKNWFEKLLQSIF